MNSNLSFLINLCLILNCIFSFQAFAQTEEDPLLVEAQLIPHSWSPGLGGELQLKLSLPKDFHAYEEQFKIKIISPEGFKISQPRLNPVVEFFDKNSNKKRKGITNSSTLKASLEAPEVFYTKENKMLVELTYQACGETYCLFPVTKKIEVPIDLQIEIKNQIAESTRSSSLNSSSLQEKLISLLSEGSLLAFIFVFLAGILTSFTPCIFPMIPITLSILSQGAEKRSRLENFLLSVFYVVGIAVTYAILGVIAASSGSVFGASLGNKYVLSIVCFLFFIMSLSMYGLFEIQMPAFIRNKFGRGHHKTGFIGAFISGLFAGIVASPCVGPVLVSILAFVSTSHNKVFGFFLLFTYALGLGLIFLLIGLFGQVTKYLPRSGPWMEGIKFVLGSMMLGVFYYYLSYLLPQKYFDISLGIGLITLASLKGAFLQNPHNSVQKLKKGLLLLALQIGIVSIAIGLFNLRPMMENNSKVSQQAQHKEMIWKKYSADVVEQAKNQHKPIIIDFWAEWCAACVELKEKTFSDSRVIDFTKDIILLQFDATQDSEELTTLKKKFGLQGLPTVLFIDEQGLWRRDLTLTEFETADKFMQRVQKLRPKAF